MTHSDASRVTVDPTGLAGYKENKALGGGIGNRPRRLEVHCR
jgi:hypothetical protein